MSFLSIALLYGGITLLSLAVPGWSYLLGLPGIIVGITLVILTIDEVAKKLFVPPDCRTVRCNVCGKLTYTCEDIGDENIICGHCRENLADELLKIRGVRNRGVNL